MIHPRNNFHFPELDDPKSSEFGWFVEIADLPLKDFNILIHKFLSIPLPEFHYIVSFLIEIYGEDYMINQFTNWGLEERINQLYKVKLNKYSAEGLWQINGFNIQEYNFIYSFKLEEIQKIYNFILQEKMGEDFFSSIGEYEEWNITGRDEILTIIKSRNLKRNHYFIDCGITIQSKLYNLLNLYRRKIIYTK